MVTKYYGVFCARCHRFIVISSYAAEHPEVIGVQFRVPAEGQTLRCSQCELDCTYTEADIFHSSSPDGKQHQGRQKR